MGACGLPSPRALRFAGERPLLGAGEALVTMGVRGFLAMPEPKPPEEEEEADVARVAAGRAGLLVLALRFAAAAAAAGEGRAAAPVVGRGFFLKATESSTTGFSTAGLGATGSMLSLMLVRRPCEGVILAELERRLELSPSRMEELEDDAVMEVLLVLDFFHPGGASHEL